MVKIVIKWGKQTYDNFEAAQDENVLSIKARLYSLTNVPVEKQKLLFKGTTLKVSRDKYKSKDC